jgi:3-hydroxyisobutyrate dehydrogenase-like beta-hydroxyacid dehydrogenase
MTSRVGVIGLGIMGGAMARNLLADGIEVAGYDPATAAAAAFRDAGGSLLASPFEVGRVADLVLVSVASSGALHEVVSGENGLDGASRPGLVVIEASTLPLFDKEAARAALAEKGAVMIDCPISGTGAQAATRDLVFLASGDPDSVAAARPLLERLGRTVKEVGPFGAGSKVKYVANLLVSIYNVATAEAMVLAARAGLDPAMVFDVLYDSAATSRIFQLRAPFMVEGVYEPATAKVSMFVKDLDVIGSFANSLSCPTPLLAAIRPIYAAAMAQGMAELDGAAVHAVLEQMAGIER